MGGVGLFRRVVLRREFHLFSPITRGIQWLLRLHLDGSVGWAGLGSQSLAWEDNVHVLSRNEDEHEGL